MSDKLICVSSRQLESAAARIRRRKRSMRLAGMDVLVTASQLERAAKILKDAEPSVITSPRRLASVHERPGFIHEDRQDDPEVLVFDVGVLTSESYRISRRGKVVEVVEQ